MEVALRLVLTALLFLSTLGISPALAVTAEDCRTGNVNPSYLRPGGFCSALLGGSLSDGGDGSCRPAPGANGFWGQTCFLYTKGGKDYYSTSHTKDGDPVVLVYVN